MSKIIINIGRQLGSGGREVARRLAETFGCKFYDKELLNLAARESGFSEKFFEQNDEHKGFLRTLFHVHVPHLSDNSFYSNNFSEESLFKFQSDAIRKAADEDNCVFVGRCADYVLRDHAEATNVFITASMEWRIAQVSKRHECDEQTARKIIHNAESQRASYYNYYTGKRWGDAASYDLCIDTSILGIDDTHQLIADFIRKRLDKDRERQ
ncbi:MAG: cytidylate kinase-like family protein [Prevotella sp.]|nr:cytidylate kinase-like family protein [Prevotella sp.]